MATIRDVAKKARVSISTVSRVINDTGYVSAETRRRVQAAMQELHYYPNEIARSLKRRNTNSIGLALTDISNPFFGEVAQAVEQAARDRGYSLLFATTGDDEEQEEACLDLFLEKQVDGIVWFGPSDVRKLEEVTSIRRVPVVVITATPGPPQLNSVYVNDARGAYEAVAHLIRLGHRKIGYIAEPDRPGTSQERLRGYEWALKDFGVELDAGLIVRGTFREGSGSKAVLQLMDQPHRPTAVFAANDLMAIEAMHQLRSLGFRVPEDIAVVGFDDVKMAGLVGIDLTTVCQPKVEMGREAAWLLIDQMQSPKAVRQVILSPHLVIRKSCGYHLSLSEKYASHGG